MLNGELNVPLSVTTIIGNTVVIMSIYMEKTIAASPSNKIPFGLTDRDVGVGFLVQKLTWLILMKSFNILSNLLQYNNSFPTIAAVSVDRIPRDLSTLTLPGACHHSSYCLSLRSSEAHRCLFRFDADLGLGFILTCCTVDHRVLHRNYCRNVLQDFYSIAKAPKKNSPEEN